MDDAPERPTDVGENHAEHDAGDDCLVDGTEVGGGELFDLCGVELSFLADVAQLEVGIAIAGKFEVDDPESVSVVEEILGNQVVVAGDVVGAVFGKRGDDAIDRFQA